VEAAARHPDMSRMQRQGQQELTEANCSKPCHKILAINGWWMMGSKCMEQAN